METRCFSSGLIIPSGCTYRRNMTRVVMVHNTHRQPKRASTPPSKSYTTSKVFEDQATGIVCYTDQNGEVVCEGYDEGPRFSRQTPHKIYHQRHRELQIPSFLQQRWPQIKEDVEPHLVKGSGFQEQN